MRTPYFALPFMVAACLLLSGCASVFEAYDDSGPEVMPSATNTDDAVASKTLKSYADKLSAATTADAKKEVLKDYIYYRMAGIDVRYNKYRNALYRGVKGVNLAADVAVTGMGLAGSLVGGVAAETLSAASAGVTSVKSSVSSTIFINNTIATLIQRMDADRSKIKTTMIANMAGKQFGSTVYASFAAADIDLIAYEEAGRLPNALISVSGTASTTLSACNAYQAEIAKAVASGDEKEITTVLSKQTNCK